MADTSQAKKNGENNPLMVNSVAKAFRILTVFNRREPRLSLVQIADKLEIDRSTAQRFTHTLMTLGYLNKDEATKTFGVSVQVLNLAHIFLSTDPLVVAAMPYLIQLSQATGETVNLAMLDGDETIFVSRVVGNHMLSTGVTVGTRIPAYAGASGLAILSAMPIEEATERVNRMKLVPLTPKTIYKPDEIVATLVTARRKGYSVSAGNYSLDDVSLGAPIFSRSGELMGAISLATSADRMGIAEAEVKYADVLLSAANSLVV